MKVNVLLCELKLCVLFVLRNFTKNIALGRIYACPRSVFPGLMSEDAQQNHFYACLRIKFSEISGSGNPGFTG